MLAFASVTAGRRSAALSEIREALLQIQWLWRQDDGKSMVEYGLLLMLVSLAAAAALTTLWSAFHFLARNLSSSAQAIK